MSKEKNPTKVKLAGEMVDIDDMCLEDLQEYCAWNDESELGLLWQFIVENKLTEKAEEFLAEKAREEIRECQS
jgi:hypothetical protein